MCVAPAGPRRLSKRTSDRRRNGGSRQASTSLRKRATAAAGQTQISVEEATAALDPARWNLVVAEDRPRAQTGTGVDAVIRAQRRS